MPWVADAPAANTVPSATESAPEQAVTETQSLDSTVEGRAIEAMAPRQEAPVPPVVAEEPAPTTQRSDITAPPPSVPQKEVSAPPVATEPPPPVTAERHIPKAHTTPPPPRGPSRAAVAREAARREARGRAADTGARSEENRARGSWCETGRRGAECRAQVSRQSARHSRKLLCRRRDAAHDHDPTDINTGRLLLFCSALTQPRLLGGSVGARRLCRLERQWRVRVPARAHASNVHAAREVAIGKAHPGAAEAALVELLDAEAGLERHSLKRGADRSAAIPQRARRQPDRAYRSRAAELDGPDDRTVAVDPPSPARAIETIEREKLTRHEPPRRLRA